MFKIRKRLIIFSLLFLGVLAAIHFVSAADLNTGLDYAAKTGLGAQDIRVTIAKIVRIILGFLGLIAVGLILYAGWLWMSSEGNEEKVSQAKKVLKNAIIGLIIILSAFAIVSFVLNRLLAATVTGNLAGGGPGPGGGGIAALGNGIIESHYPARNQQDVPRNTKIAITFKEPIDATTIMNGDQLNSQNIIIYKTVDGLNGPHVTEVTARKTDDNKTFVFKPKEYLGSSSEKIWYTVALSKNIKKANGDAAFGGVVGNIAYDWTFQVGTFVDLTPPKIVSIIPLPSATEPRNVVIQINFSEAVDPISASGETKNGFDNIVINNKTDNGTVQGNFYSSNQYQTIEFLTEDACGVNSCGNTIYCLPGNKNLSPLVKAATLVAAGEPEAVFPYTGIVDMADNSFDGNGDGVAEGPQTQSGKPPFNANNPTHDGEGDDYVWSFNTNNTIDLTPPQVAAIAPGIKEEGVSLDTVPEATFNKFLMSASITSDSVTLGSQPASLLNYWLSKQNKDTEKQTVVSLNHDQFKENTQYAPNFNSGIKDIYQNCYSPCSGLGVQGGPSCCNGVAGKNNTCQ